MAVAEWLKSKFGWCWLAIAFTAPATMRFGAPGDSSETQARPPGTHAVIQDPKSASPERAAVLALAAPKAASGHRSELAPAFTKATPGSIGDLKEMERQVQALVVRLSPAVVAIDVGMGSGSGVIISEDGLVLTAGHVVGASNRNVRFTLPDGRTARGKTLGLDAESDTGLMRITSRGAWPHAPVGELGETRLGDWVLALGHPGGFDSGRSLVVRLGRIVRMSPEMLQTDCTISSGDSGGPLFDMHGRVIGIHSAITTSLSGNLHVPITAFYETWARLIAPEAAELAEAKPRVRLGAKIVDAPVGCLLSGVEPGGLAAKAGLKAGDLVLRVEGRDIKAPAALERWLAEAAPGETLELEVKRGERRLSLKLTLPAGPDTK